MIETEPVILQEDKRTGDRFLIYGTDKGTRLDIRYLGDSLWMTQAQIADLFGRDVSVISRHISNILEEGELEEASSLQKAQTSTGRPATLYSRLRRCAAGTFARVRALTATRHVCWNRARFGRSGMMFRIYHG